MRESDEKTLHHLNWCANGLLKFGDGQRNHIDKPIDFAYFLPKPAL